MLSKSLRDPPQSPLKRGKKKILPLFKGGWGDLYKFSNDFLKLGLSIIKKY